MCADAIVESRPAGEFLPEDSWSIETRSRTEGGKSLPTYFARNRSVDFSVQYWPGTACWVFGSVPHREFDGRIDESRSIGLVVEGAETRLADQYRVRGYRAGGLDNPILMADDFEVEFTMLRASRFEGSTYGIRVSHEADPGAEPAPSPVMPPAAMAASPKDLVIKDSSLPDKPSRLIPQPAPQGTSPPVVISMTPSPAVERKPEVLPDAVTIERIVELARLCQQVLTPDFAVNANLLWENGWAWTRPRPARMGSITGEQVEYSRRNTSETIAVSDFGRFAVCRAIARIESPEAMDEARAALASGLGAEEIAEADIDPEWKRQVLGLKPVDQQKNVLVSNTYTIELTEETTDVTGMNVVGADSVTLLMAEIAPLPPARRR